MLYSVPRARGGDGIEPPPPTPTDHSPLCTHSVTVTRTAIHRVTDHTHSALTARTEILCFCPMLDLSLRSGDIRYHSTFLFSNS